MKEIKLIHAAILVILTLFALAIFQWTKLPKSSREASGITASDAPSTTLPLPPQGDVDKLNAPTPFAEVFSPFEESPGKDDLEPKDPEAGSHKALL